MKWLSIAFVSIFGALYIIRGLVALSDGREVAMFLKYGYPVTPTTCITVGLMFLFGALYFALVRKKPDGATNKKG